MEWIGCVAGKNKTASVKPGDQPWDNRRRKQTFSH